jgi:HEPN domain-containing protein
MNDEPWRVWLRRARSNLARAELGKQAEDILYEDLCFDAQQAVEKALKGLMVFLNIEIPKTHSVGYLLGQIEESGKAQVPESLRDAPLLTDYAVTARYPGDWDAVGEAEYEHAVNLAREVYRWVASITARFEA